MIRSIVFTVLAFVGLGVSAQAFDPTISYSLFSGTAKTIYLANQDGTKATPVYTGGKGKALSGVDIAPGGGRVAFVEQGALKVLPYTVSNSGITPGQPIQIDSNLSTVADFSPDGEELIYGKSNPLGGSDIIVNSSGGGGTSKTLVYGVSGLMKVAWLGTGFSGPGFVYLAQRFTDLAYAIHYVTLDSLGNVWSNTVPISTDGAANGAGAISDVDSARGKRSILLTLNYPTTIRVVEYNFDTPGFTDHVVGMNGRFSNDDSKIVHLDFDRNYIYSYSVASKLSTRLTKRGSFNFIDARP